MLGASVGGETLDGLVASSPSARPSHWQLRCMPRCHMSQPPESNQNVAAWAQRLKEQDESERRVVIVANWPLPPRSVFGSVGRLLGLTQAVSWLRPWPGRCAWGREDGVTWGRALRAPGVYS